MKVVHHSTYLFWFEVGRTSLLAAVGFPYDKLETSGTLFPVIEYTCRLTDSADYGDTVRIDTVVRRLRSRAVEFAYEVFNRDVRIATGVTTHVAVDIHHKPRRMTPELIAALQPYVTTKNES